MRFLIKTLLAFLCTAMVVPTGAFAASVTTFEFSGTANAGANSLTVGPGFPAGGVQQIDNAAAFDANAYAALVGAGDDNPLTFASGVAAAGEADATMTTRVQVVITNDTGVTMDAVLNSLIFAGGVGVANPDFTATDCLQSNIAQCGTFAAGDLDILLDQSAALEFDVLVDGMQVFGGDIQVDSSGVTSSFDNIALNNFGPSAGNPDFVTWDETEVNVNLGSLAAGESLTLEFLVSATAISTGQSGCTPTTFECRLSLAGFGDPVDMGGVFLFAIQGNPDDFPIGVDLVDPAEVPLPPAAFLFLFGAAALSRKGLVQR